MDINQSVVELLEVLKQGLATGNKLANEQFHILCQQIIKWGIFFNISAIILSVIMMLVSYNIILWGIKKNKEDGYYDNCTNNIVGGFLGVFFAVLCLYSIYELFQITLVPNIYLIEYFKGLMHNGGG